MAITLTVEDGSNVTDANSYISFADAEVYFTENPNATAWTGEASDERKKAALVYAVRLMEQLIKWNGARTHLEFQQLDFPRQYLLHKDETHFLDPSSIPDFVIWVQCELAKMLLETDLTAEEDGAGLKSLKVDVIELEFNGKTSTKTIPKIVSQLIAHYGAINYGGGFLNVHLA